MVYFNYSASVGGKMKKLDYKIKTEAIKTIIDGVCTGLAGVFLHHPQRSLARAQTEVDLVDFTTSWPLE